MGTLIIWQNPPASDLEVFDSGECVWVNRYPILQVHKKTSCGLQIDSGTVPILAVGMHLSLESWVLIYLGTT